MKQYLTLLGGALMLAACSNASAIEDAVKDDLIDPDSARFGELIEYTDKEGDQNACIMVNAKNRMGGYTGEKPSLLMRDEEGDWQSLGTVDLLPGLTCAGYVQMMTGDKTD